MALLNHDPADAMTGTNIAPVVVMNTTTKFFELDGGWEADYEGTQIRAMI